MERIDTGYIDFNMLGYAYHDDLLKSTALDRHTFPR